MTRSTIEQKLEIGSAYEETEDGKHLLPVCHPEEIHDSVEDEIREMVHPVKLPPAVIKGLADFIRRRAEQPDVDTAKIPVEYRVRVFNELLELFNPSEWTPVQWWAIQYAIRSKHTENINISMMAQNLGMTRALFNHHVRGWQKQLRIPKTNSAMQEGVRLMHKHERRAPRCRPARPRKSF